MTGFTPARVHDISATTVLRVGMVVAGTGAGGAGAGAGAGASAGMVTEAVRKR